MGAVLVAPKILSAIVVMLIYYVYCKLLFTISRSNKTLNSNWIKVPGKLTVRFCLLTVGVFWLEHRISEVDYSKYLGKDWKPTYEKPTTVIGNHSCWMDIFGDYIIKQTSFIARDGIRKFPIIGLFTDVWRTFYLSRQIKDRTQAE